jgi:hypothetical protein
MQTVPVFAVLGRTLRLAFLRYPTAFRLAWFPLALNEAVVLSKQLAVDHVAAANAAGVWTSPLGLAFLDPVVVAWAAVPALVFTLLGLIAVTAAMVAIARWALFDEARAGEYFIFNWGPVESRYSGAIVLTTILAVVLAVVYAYGFRFVLSGADLDMLQASARQVGGRTIYPFAALTALSWPVQLYAALGLAAVLYPLLRLYVWPSAIVANETWSIGHSIAATAGQTIRLFLVSVMTLFAVFTVAIAVAVLAASLTGGSRPPVGTDGSVDLRYDVPEVLTQFANHEFGDVAKAVAPVEVATPVPGLSGLQTELPLLDPGHENPGASIAPQDQPSLQANRTAPADIVARIVGFLLSIFLIGASVASGAFAYRAMRGGAITG